MREIFLVTPGWQVRGCSIAKVVVEKETKQRLYLKKEGVDIVGEWAYVPIFVEKESPRYHWFDTLEEAKAHVLTQLEARLRDKRHQFSLAENALVKAHKDLEGI